MKPSDVVDSGPECYVADDITCDNCGAVISTATAVGSLQAEPKEGDASICWYCGHMAIFVDSFGELRPVTEKERADLLANPHVQEILKHVKCKTH